MRRSRPRFNPWLSGMGVGVFCAAVFLPQSARTAAAVPGLGAMPEAALTRLRHRDPMVRRGAVWSLGRWPPASAAAQDGSVTPRLREMLVRETDLSTSLAIVATLATRAWPQSSETLLDLADLRGREAAAVRPEIQAAALQAIGTLGDADEGTLRILLEAGATDGPVPLRGDLAPAAARAIAELPDFALDAVVQRGRLRPGQMPGVMRGLGLRGDPRAGQLALAYLVSPPQPATVAAIEAVARLRLTEAVPRLVALIHDAGQAPEQLVVRRAAIRALGVLGGGDDAAVLAGALADPAVRDAALEACAATGDASWVPAMTPWLSAPWPTDRVRAAEALGELGSTRGIAVLVDQARREPVQRVRRALWHAVGRLGGASAVENLVAHAEDPDARWSLAAMGLQGRAVRGVPGVDAPARMVRAMAGEPVDTAGLQSASPDERLATALALRVAGGELAAAETRLRTEDDEGVRVVLVQALGRRLADAGAVEALCGLLAREADEPSTAAVVAASEIGRHGVYRASPDLRRLLRSSRADARAEAAHALGMLGDVSARTALMEGLMFDPDPQARGAAGVALASILGREADAPLRTAATTAWTDSLWELLARARAAARTGSRPWFEGRSVAWLTDAPPRSVWSAALPDGGHAWGVAGADGVVLMPGVPSADSELQCPDAPHPTHRP